MRLESAGNRQVWLGGLGLAVWLLGVAFERTSATLCLRLFALGALALYAGRRRSLTLWIFWSMLAGVEFGLDLPRAALASRVFSDIFLRLIKSIVAPLIFGTEVARVL